VLAIGVLALLTFAVARLLAVRGGGSVVEEVR